MDFLQFGTVFGSDLGFWWRKFKDFEGPWKIFYRTDSNNFLFFENVSISFVHFCNLWEHRTRLRHHTTPITYAIFEKVTFTALPLRTRPVKSVLNMRYYCRIGKECEFLHKVTKLWLCEFWNLHKVFGIQVHLLFAKLSLFFCFLHRSKSPNLSYPLCKSFFAEFRTLALEKPAFQIGTLVPSNCVRHW